MEISVCVPASRSSTVAATIASVQRQSHSDWDLGVVCERGNTQLADAVDAATRQDARVRLLQMDGRGCARARNHALAAARGSVIAFIDDDCEAASDWLAVLSDCFSRRPEVGLVAGSLVPVRPTRPILFKCPELLPSESIYDPVASGRRPPPGFDWAGANFAMRREVAARVGAFDERLGAGTPFASAEDVDYKFRLEALGVSMWSTPRATVHHTHGYRIGLRSTMSYQRGQAKGTGAMAAKLTLLGDPRGREWLDRTRDRCLNAWHRRRRPERLLIDLRHLWHFATGYRECLRGYIVDEAGLLAPRPASRAPHVATPDAG